MATISLFDKPETMGGGFDFYDFKNAISRAYGDLIAEYFAQAIHEQSGVLLENASRFAKLVAWCDDEIKAAAVVINTFTPVDKTASYTTGDAKLWREHVHYIAELLYFRGLLVDHRTTTAQRENIEYTICRLYGIQYNENIGVYI